MPLSYQRYTGNGTTTDFTLSFPYMNKEHIFVRVDSVITAFSWVNTSTIRITPAVVKGKNIWIYRTTPKEQSLTQFKDGVGFREADLNRVVTQLLYITQEAYENADLPLIATWREEIQTARNETLEARDTAVTVINTERTAAVNAVKSERTAAVNAVKSERTAAVNAVNNERLKAVSEIRPLVSTAKTYADTSRYSKLQAAAHAHDSATSAWEAEQWAMEAIMQGFVPAKEEDWLFVDGGIIGDGVAVVFIEGALF